MNNYQKLPQRKFQFLSALMVIAGLWLITANLILPVAEAQSPNLALNKPVTCSSVENAGTACANAVDGNTGTRWASAFSDPQWIRVDLGATNTIGRVVLRWEAAYGKSYQIQTSNDATNWTNIYTTTTGDGGVDDITVTGSGRYVRMNGTVRATQYGYSLWEFEVYGGATPTRTPTLVSTECDTPSCITPPGCGTTVVVTSTPTKTPSPTASATPSATPTKTPTATNTACGPIYITATPTSTAPPGLPDLVVQSMFISGNQSCFSSSFQLGVQVTVANTGTGNASAFVVNVNSWTQTVSGGLLAGQTTSLFFPGYNSGTPNIATVDSTNLVTESNESNNTLSQMLPIPTAPPPCTPTPTPTGPTPTPGLPDLVVNSIQAKWVWYNNCNGGALQPNTNVGIQNTGTSNAGAFQLALANPTSSISQTVSGLTAGQFLTVVFVMNGYPLTATVDSTNMVIESNEINNSRSTFRLPGTPAPTATGTWTPPPPFPTCTPTPTLTHTPTPTRTNTPIPSGNLALNKPVTCSSVENAGTACANAVDGNTGTRWASAFSDPQWIRVDLGATNTIGRIVLRWETAYGKSYQLQTSNDAVNWTTIYSTTTGDGGVDDITVTGSGRYIRMNGTVRATQYGYSLWEFEVYN